MTTGQAWQFRPYKWSEPRALFHHGKFQLACSFVSGEFTANFHLVKGVYVQWANDPPNTKISDWNVTPLKVYIENFLVKQHLIFFKIEPNRRHVDKSVVAEFWKILDAWMLANKPWLMR